MNSQKKFNMFQRGILQAIAYGIVGAFCLIAIDATFQYIGQYKILQNPTFALVMGFIGVVAVCAGITVALLWVTLRLNLTWQAILPKAVEFTSAMRKLGLFDFDTQLAFISAQKMHVFIADKPMLHDVQENVCGRRYMFLAHKDVLVSHKGKGRLCLDAEEYERIARDVQTPFSALESAAVAEREAEIATLQEELRHKTAELDRLAAENASHKEECAVLQSSGGTAPGRNQRIDNLHVSRAPFWLVAVPLIQRLRRDHVTDTEYSKDTIQAEFERELENYPAFKQAVKNLLATGQKVKGNTPFALEGWGMRAICDILREYGVKIKSTPGPESKK